MNVWVLYPFVVFLGFLAGYLLSLAFAEKKEGFASNINAFKSNPNYKKQLNSIVSRFDGPSGSRRGITDMLATTRDMPSYEQCLVNFQVLGCRFTGYLGPFENGFVDIDNSILYALKAGCRCFTFEIDYIDTCDKRGQQFEYFPKLVVRDVQGKIVTFPESDKPMCNSDGTSNIRMAADSLRRYAFASNVQNSNDPLIIVLYLLRLPPRETTGNKRLLTYYSRIAKALNPLIDKSVASMISGGNYSRQQQESKLLINNLTDYEGRVLFFCNSDTSSFRSASPLYPQNEDLDYIVNLRLSYKQTQLGCTTNQTGGSFGGLETTGSFITTPTSQIENTCAELKLRWTTCLSDDPSQPVPEKTFSTLSNQFGVHCVPIQLFDTTNTFMFTDERFKKYSFIPKPKTLRYTKPPVVVPAKQAVEANSNGGSLRAPSIS
jgi:hypothetical protein